MTREEAFTAFVAARGPALRRTAYLMTGNWHEAEDVVQTALSKLYVAWARVDSDGAEAYVRRIVANVIVDGRRRSWRGEQATADLPDVLVEGPDVDERLVQLRALMSMPAAQRAVIVLRYWEDLSIEQVADLLGIAAGTVRSQTSRGLTALREAMGVSVSGDEVT
jgi:RNA polymerase sigma-70 factor (sigma-E family)